MYSEGKLGSTDKKKPQMPKKYIYIFQIQGDTLSHEGRTGS